MVVATDVVELGCKKNAVPQRRGLCRCPILTRSCAVNLIIRDPDEGDAASGHDPAIEL